jgi:molybdopterin/thiamine biosynthesis adenylyltransferase
MAARDAAGAGVFVSCLDNMQSRWVLNCVAHILGAPLVNGGVNAFAGTADFVNPLAADATLVTRYGDAIKTDTGKVQCGGAVPILSIVTTNAVIASIEAIFAICALIGRQPASNRLFFDGTERVLHGDTFKEKGVPDPLGIGDVLRSFELD